MRYDADGAWTLLQSAKEVWIINRSKLLRLPPTAENRAAILEKALGRSGNLRAPTLRVGETYVVGVLESVYTELFAPA